MTITGLVWNLHKRIALFVLTRVGARPRFLLDGFMGTTSFISRWMSNVATTAMMTPIAQAVLVQLKDVATGTAVEDTSDGTDAADNNNKIDETKIDENEPLKAKDTDQDIEIKEQFINMTHL